jgi:hypothetical protein
MGPDLSRKLRIDFPWMGAQTMPDVSAHFGKRLSWTAPERASNVWSTSYCSRQMHAYRTCRAPQLPRCLFYLHRFLICAASSL